MSTIGTGRAPNTDHRSDERYTPGWIIEWARQVMGGIDLDPASCPEANQTVQAARYYTTEDDGLTQPWYGRVWLNPPYRQKLCRQFAEKLIEQLPYCDSVMALTLTTFDARWFRALLANASAYAIFDGLLTFKTVGGTHAERYALRPFGVAYFGNPDTFLETGRQLLAEGKLTSLWESAGQPPTLLDKT